MDHQAEKTMHVTSFATEGFALVQNLLPQDECSALAARFSLEAHGSAGSRCLLEEPWCREIARRIGNSASLTGIIAPHAVAVQCTYFEKSVQRNWIVPTHQDLSIAVREKIAHPGLRGWSEKEGELFVQSPPEILEQLVAVRVHLDPCDEHDGPVRVYSGSHRLGLIDPASAAVEKHKFKEVECVAEIGSALVMSPLLLHASSKASGTSLRRVLHFLFGPPVLPLGLQWRYAVPLADGGRREEAVPAMNAALLP